MKSDFLRRASCGLFLSLAVAVALLPGCGGNHSETTPTTASTSTTATRKTGRATVTITWPKRGGTRLIPTAANSIRVDMVLGSATVATQLVARPTDGQVSTLTFANLPVGALTVAARAFPTSDGSGVAQAQGTAPLTTLDGQTVGFRVVMDSTVDHLGISPSAPTLTVGQTQTLIATAYNADNAVVLTAPSKITWASSDPSVTVDASGGATAVSVGASTLTATDTESGKSTTTVLTVQPAPTPTPTPGDLMGFPQFNPKDPGIPLAIGDPVIGDLNSASGAIVNTDDATIRNGQTGALIAVGTLITRSYPTERRTITYAIFNYDGDVTFTGTTLFTGGNPFVLLSRGNIYVNGDINYEGWAVKDANGRIILDPKAQVDLGPGRPAQLSGGEALEVKGDGAATGRVRESPMAMIWQIKIGKSPICKAAPVPSAPITFGLGAAAGYISPALVSW